MRRGDELPEQLRTAAGRREFFAGAKLRRRRDRTDGQEPVGEGSGEAPESRPEPEFELDQQRIVARTQGREGWWREARRQLEQHRWREAERIPRSRSGRLLVGAERCEDELAAECRGNEAYEQARERPREVGGHRVGGPPKPYQPPEVPAGKPEFRS